MKLILIHKTINAFRTLKVVPSLSMLNTNANVITDYRAAFIVLFIGMQIKIASRNEKK